MLFADPVRGPIHGPGWKRPSGNHDFVMNQDFGPTAVTSEPKVIWPGGEDIAKGTYNDFHQGIDLNNGRAGDDVLAVAAGRIDFAGIDGTGNRVVIVNHGRWRSWYGHLASENVSVGQQVSTSQKLGTIGQSGNASGPHLHLAIEWLDFPGDVVAVRPSGTSHFKFVDGWRRLVQNVTVHLAPDDGINIRSTAGSGTTLGPLFATTKGGHIHRTDGVDLGPTATPRRWAGTVKGASYTVRGIVGSSWETIEVDGKWRYVASPLAVVSQR